MLNEILRDVSLEELESREKQLVALLDRSRLQRDLLDSQINQYDSGLFLIQRELRRRAEQMEPGYYWARVYDDDYCQVIQVTEKDYGETSVLLFGSGEWHELDCVTKWGERVVRGGNVVMNQYGENCTQITNAGILTIKMD